MRPSGLKKIMYRWIKNGVHAELIKIRFGGGGDHGVAKKHNRKDGGEKGFCPVGEMGDLKDESNRHCRSHHLRLADSRPRFRARHKDS